jgi:hypothetical protein
MKDNLYTIYNYPLHYLNKNVHLILIEMECNV